MKANRFLAKFAALVAVAATLRGAPPAEEATHERRSMEGWTLLVSKALLERDRAATEHALELLRTQLKQIVERVPAPAVVRLREVPLWISPEYPETQPRAEYHPNAQWLREHHRDPAMAKGVEFTNVRIFEAECRRMPVFVLHELAHSYHDRVLGFEDAEIKAAWQHALDQHLYNPVERHHADGHITTERAYALTNPKEFFAECSEALFGENDFFPFTRKQLQDYDPQTYSLLTRLWGQERP